MIDQKDPRLHRWGHATAMILLAVLVGGALMLWAWNMIAVELFQAPAVQFKHVLAIQAAIVALTTLPVVIVRCLRRGGTRSNV